MDSNTLAQWSAIITIVSTVVLVIVNIGLVILNRNMIREMERGRQLGLMPVVTCRIECDLKRSRREGAKPLVPGEFNDVKIVNVGNAPAIDVEVALTLLNRDESTLNLVDQRWTVGTVGVEERSFPTAQAKLVTDLLAEPRVTVTIEYRNVYQKSFKTVIVFARDAPEQQTGQELPTCTWIKQDETTTLSSNKA